jgi:hypothetical protein
MYKLFVFCPDKEEVIHSIMKAASEAGAGVIGNYTNCGFYSKGTGNWKSEVGSNPTIGKVGDYSHEPEVKIEMICPKEKAPEIRKAIRKVHPYEEPEIDFIQLIDVE